jgi:hypothetical protein
VLSDPKYSQLPSVYKNSVKLSENEMDVQAEADKVLEQYQSDFGIAKQTFGKPSQKSMPDKKEATGILRSADDLRAKLAERLRSR